MKPVERCNKVRYLCLAASVLFAGCGGASWRDGRLYEPLYVEMNAYNQQFNREGPQAALASDNAISALVHDNYETLVLDLKGSDVEKRKLAAFGLGFSHNVNVVPELINAFADQDREVRRNALASVGILGILKTATIRDVPVLLNRIRPLMRDRDENIAAAAMFAIQNLIVEGQDPGIMADVNDLMRSAKPRIRNEAVILAGKMRRRDAESRIIALLTDDDALVRRNASSALGLIAGWDAVDFLIEMLQDPEHVVVAGARDSLEAITRETFGASYSRWKDWWDDYKRKRSLEKIYEYYCPICRHVQDVAGFCPRCSVELKERRKEMPQELEFFCPDHGNVQSAPGQCPTCKRDLQSRPKSKVYVCPDGHEGAFDKPGKCATCQKDLIEKK